MEVKVQRDTKVIICLDEVQAGQLMSALEDQVNFSAEPWAAELFDALMAQEVSPRLYARNA